MTSVYQLPLFVLDKRCPRCGLVKPVEQFNKNRAQRDGLAPYCKACKKLTAAQYRTPEYKQRHRDVARERMRAKRAALPDYNKAICQAYYRRHHVDRLLAAEVYRAAHRVVIRRKAHDDRAQHPHKFRVRDAAKHARRYAAEGHHTADDVRRQHQAQAGQCYWCGDVLDQRYHVDHVVPLVRGGTNWPDNIVIACRICNQRKQAALPEQWAKKLRRILENRQSAHGDGTRHVAEATPNEP